MKDKQNEWTKKFIIKLLAEFGTEIGLTEQRIQEKYDEEEYDDEEFHSIVLSAKQALDQYITDRIIEELENIHKLYPKASNYSNKDDVAHALTEIDIVRNYRLKELRGKSND